MPSKVFINLPTKDLQASMNFFKALGFSFNPQFTDENAGCMVVSDSIFVMILKEEYFKTFTKKPISDAKKSTEVLIALDASSVQEVKDTIAKAKSLGAKIYAEANDHGWMYQHSFEDLDGHQWEFAYMDLSQLPQSPQ